MVPARSSSELSKTKLKSLERVWATDPQCGIRAGARLPKRVVRRDVDRPGLPNRILLVSRPRGWRPDHPECLQQSSAAPFASELRTVYALDCAGKRTVGRHGVANDGIIGAASTAWWSRKLTLR